MKVGFARVDMTPPLGTHLCGYFHVRPADGIITPLYINAVAFDDGKKKAAVVTLDLEGMNRVNNEVVRKYAAEHNGLDEESIFISCTHTHLGPCLDDFTKETSSPYCKSLVKKISDAVSFAFEDLCEVKKTSVASGKAEGISFVRLYRMKDGSTKTNPGSNPDVVGPIGTPDESVYLVRFEREDAPDVAIVNFGTHPDVIGSVKECACKICYDWPGFVRDILEQTLTEVADGKGVHAICINGVQGDVNHVDRLKRRNGVEHSKHMARVIAGEVLGMYTFGEKVDCGKLFYKHKPVLVPLAKGTPEEVAMAKRVRELQQQGSYAAVKAAIARDEVNFDYSVACKFLRLENAPEEKNLYVSCIGFDDVALVGFPGEPFTEIGRQTKAASPFKLTMTACMANGGEGYFPMKEIYYDGGYEASTSNYKVGTAEKLIEAAIELTKELKNR